MAKRQKHYNGEKPEKTFASSDFSHNLILRQLNAESGVLGRIGRDFTGKDSNIYQLSAPSKKSSFQNSFGNDFLKYLVNEFDIVPSPKKQSGRQLMHKTIEYDKYVPMSSTLRRNPIKMEKSFNRALNSNEFIVFDLETLSGRNALGRQEHDFITEVSFRHYTDAPIGTDITRNTQEGKHNLKALIGLSETDANKVESILDSYLNGKTSFDDLEERQQVYIKELLKFSDAKVGTHNGLKYVSEKLGSDEVDKLLRGSKENIVRDVRKGISFLKENYDASTFSSVKQKVSDTVSYVQNSQNAVLVSANGLRFDAPYIHNIFGIDIDDASHFDVTELHQMKSAIDGFATRGGATVSSLFKQYYPDEYEDLVKMAHVADIDTYMTAKIFMHENIRGMINDSLQYNRDHSQNLRIGGIYNIDSTLRSNLAFQTDGKYGIGSTGLFYQANNGNGKFTTRSFEYDGFINSNAPYVITGMKSLDFDSLPDDIKKQARSYLGADKMKTKGIHAVTFEPFYHSGFGRAEMPGVTHTSQYRTTMFLTDDEFDYLVSGVGEQIGTAVLKTDESGIATTDYSRLREFTLMDNDLMPSSKVLSLNERTSDVKTERAMRKFEESKYRTLHTLDFITNQSEMDLASAIAHNDQNAIKLASAKIEELMANAFKYHKDGYHTTLESIGHTFALLPSLEQLMPVYRGIEQAINERGIVDQETHEATFNRMFEDVMDSIDVTSFSQDDKVRKTYKFSKTGERTRKIPRHQQKLTVDLSSKIVPDYKTVKTLSLDFTRPTDAYKIGDKLLNLHDVDSRSMSPTELELQKKSLLRYFVEDVTSNPMYGRQAKDAFIASNVLDSSGNLIGFNDINVSSDDISIGIFNALKDNNIRSKLAKKRLPPMASKETKKVLSYGGNVLKNDEDITSAARRIASSIATVSKIDKGNLYGGSDSHRKLEMQKFYNALIDDDLMNSGAYYKYMTGTLGFDESVATARQKLYNSAISDYKRIIDDIVTGYNVNGISFSVENGDIYARDASSTFVKLNIPKLKISSNGTAYIEYGRKNVALSYGMDDSGRITSTFTDAAAPWRSTKRSIARNGGVANIRGLLSDMSYRFGEIGDASDVTSMNRTHFFSSGGSFDITNIATRLFAAGGFDENEALNGLKRDNIAVYQKLKDLYTAGTKYRGVPTNITGIGTEFQTYFYQHFSEISKSIAEWDFARNGNDGVLASVLPVLSVAESQEKMIVQGKVQVGRVSTSFESFGYNRHRPTGIQTSKGQSIRVDKLADKKFNHIYNAVESDSTENISVQKNIAGIDGLDTTTGFYAKTAHMSQAEYINAIADGLENGRITKEEVEKIYGTNSYDVIMRSITNANIENDGSIILDRAARVMPSDVVNNKYIDFVDNMSGDIVYDNNVMHAVDYIPDITINPDTGAIDVKFGKDTFVKKGSRFVHRDSDLGVKSKTLIKHDSLARVGFFKDYIELTESEVSSALGKIDGIRDALLGATSKEARYMIAANALGKSTGIRSQMLFENVALHNKIGFGEEKTLTNSLTLSIDALPESKKILDKYNVPEYLRGIAITDNAFDALVRNYKISQKDAKVLRKNMGASSDILLTLLNLEKDVSVITNVNFVKHKSSAQSISSMLIALQQSKKFANAPKRFNTFLKNALDDSASFNGSYIHVNGDLSSINTDLIINEFKEYARTSIADKNKISPDSVTDDAINSFVNATSYQRLVSMNDWEGKKYAGEITSKINHIRQQLIDGVIDQDTAKSKIAALEEMLEDNLGTLYGREEYTLLSRKYANASSLSKIISEDDTNDAVLKHYRSKLVSAGMLDFADGKYYASKEALHGNMRLYEKTLSGLQETMTKGHSYDYKLGDYINGTASINNPWYKDLIDKYSSNNDFVDYSLDKLDAYDTFERYKDIRKFNKSGSQIISDNDVVVNAADLTIASGDISKQVVGMPNNIYTNDVVIDLGEGFDRRYIKTLGINPQFYDGDSLLKAEYQSKYSTLRDMSSVYNDLMDGVNIDEYKEQFNIHDETKLKDYVKKRIVDASDAIVSLQDQYVGGKKSVATNMSSTRAQISALLESQTINPIHTLKESVNKINSDADISKLNKFDLTKDFTFGGMSLSDHSSRNRQIDYGIVSAKSAERMGLYDSDFMSQQISRLKSNNVELYNDIVKEVGEGNDRAIMDKLLRSEGVSGIIERNPHVFQDSMMAARIYVSDDINEDTIIMPLHTQKRMKNDNDSDKVSFSIFDANKVDFDELDRGIFIQSYKNASDSDLVSGNAYNLLKIMDETKIFGKHYANISDNSEFESVRQSLINSKYYDVFSEIMSTARAGSDEYVKMQDTFKSQVAEYAANHDVGSDFSNEMYSDFASQMRLDRYQLASFVNTAKDKIGFVNNRVKQLMSIGSGYVYGMLENDNLTEAERNKYIAAREAMNATQGRLIEDIINVKNTVDPSAFTRASDFSDSADALLYRSGDRAAASKRLSGIIADVAKNDLADLIGDEHSSIREYLMNNGFTAESFATESGMNDAITKASSLITDTILSTDVSKNSEYKRHIEVGSSSNVERHSFFASPAIDSDRLYYDIMQDNISNESARASFTTSESSDRIMGSNVNFGNGSGSTKQYVRQGLDALSNILNNVSGKHLALGALGLASGLMAVGYIGGNPSSAPQEDGDRMAYTEDNYNYSTGGVIPPPAMPQGPKTGYVINMRGSTNGSYVVARNNMVQAVEQNYMMNMNVNVRQNFSYSSYEDNDRYVENLIRDLM